jgi:hypothetical protein
MSKAWEFPLPNPNDSIADFMLAYDVRADITAFSDTFLAKSPDPAYVDPETYMESLVDTAYGIKDTPYTAKYAPAGWSPIKSALAVFNKAVDFMKTVKVNEGDPNSNNVYDAWVAKTGYLYGGHPLIPTAPATTGDGVNAGTGPSAGPGGILGGGTK